MPENKVNTKEQNKIIVKNGLYSSLFKGLEYIISFFSTPILLLCLGDEKYGIYTTVLSLISWLYYFDFGIGSGMRNKVTEYMVDKDYDSARKTISVAYFIISIITFAIFLIFSLTCIFFNYDTVLNANLSDENLNTILIFSVALACVNFVFSLSTNVLWALQKNALISGLGIISKLLWLLALILFYKININTIFLVAVAEGLVQLIKNILALFYINKKYCDLKFSLKKIDMKYSKGIMGFGLQIFIMQICALVLNATDNIIIMNLFGATDVTPYNLCHKYFSIINAFYVAATGGLWTAYTAAYAMKDKKYIVQTMKKALKFYILTLLGIVIALLAFKPFMRVYLGKEMPFQNEMVVSVAVYYALLIFSHNFSAFVHGISKTKLTTIACAIAPVLNVICSIFFATSCNMHITGIVIGSILSLILTTVAYVYTTIKEIRKI